MLFDRIMRFFASARGKVLVCLLWMAFIWGHSLMPGNASSEESGFFVSLLSPHLTPVPFTVDALTLLVRKIAHMTEYAVLAVLASRAYLPKRPALLAATVLLTPIIDECIQLFVPDRSGMASDVLIDLAGVCIGLACAYLFRRARARRG